MNLKINPKATLEDLIKGFDWKYITPNFKLPKDKIGKYTYRLLQLDKVVTTKELEDYVKSKGYQLPTIREVLEFGNEYPDEYKNGWIFTVEKISGQFFCAVLSARGDSRNVNVNDNHPDDNWNENYRVPVRELEPRKFDINDTLPLELIVNGITYVRKD